MARIFWYRRGDVQAFVLKIVRVMMLRRSLIGLLLMALGASPVVAANPLEVSMVLRRGGVYMEPPDGVFDTVIEPIAFHVVIQNVSRTSQETPVSNVLTFELVDEKGRSSVVQPKDSGGSSIPIFVYLSPNATRQLEVMLHPNEWENVPSLVAGEIQVFKIRAIYQTTSLKVYSKYYQLNLGRE